MTPHQSIGNVEFVRMTRAALTELNQKENQKEEEGKREPNQTDRPTAESARRASPKEYTALDDALNRYIDIHHLHGVGTSNQFDNDPKELIKNVAIIGECAPEPVREKLAQWLDESASCIACDTSEPMGAAQFLRSHLRVLNGLEILAANCDEPNDSEAILDRQLEVARAELRRLRFFGPKMAGLLDKLWQYTRILGPQLTKETGHNKCECKPTDKDAREPPDPCHGAQKRPRLWTSSDWVADELPDESDDEEECDEEEDDDEFDEELQEIMLEAYSK